MDGETGTMAGHCPCVNPPSSALDPGRVCRNSAAAITKGLTAWQKSADDRLSRRNDLAWAISVGGIGIVGFATLVLFTWYYAATLFLIFAGSCSPWHSTP